MFLFFQVVSRDHIIKITRDLVSGILRHHYAKFLLIGLVEVEMKRF